MLSQLGAETPGILVLRWRGHSGTSFHLNFNEQILANMKKTLASLLALSSMASAALTDEQLANGLDVELQNQATSLDTTTFLPQNSTSQSFTATLTLSVTELAHFNVGASTNEAIKTPVISWTIGENAHSVNVSFNNNSNGGLITTAGFYIEYSNNGNCAIPTDTTAAANKFTTNGNDATSALSSIAWADAKAAVLTLTYNGLTTGTSPLGTHIYFSVLMNNGEIKTFDAGSDGIRWTTSGNNVTAIGYDNTYLESLTIYDGFASSDQAWKLNSTALAPEPATATLSLLALVGIAARRRRK